jgi:hypothetical protein
VRVPFESVDVLRSTRGVGAVAAAHNSRLRFRRKIFLLRSRPNLDLSPLRSDIAVLLAACAARPSVWENRAMAGEPQLYAILLQCKLCKREHFLHRHESTMIEVARREWLERVRRTVDDEHEIYC